MIKSGRVRLVLLVSCLTEPGLTPFHNQTNDAIAAAELLDGTSTLENLNTVVQKAPPDCSLVRVSGPVDALEFKLVYLQVTDLAPLPGNINSKQATR